MTHILTMVFVFVLISVSVSGASAQEDFDTVRKRAMNSGSQQGAIEILAEFADEESTSAEDQVRALEFLARFCARRRKSAQANQFVIRAKTLAKQESDQRLLRNVLQIESAIANQLSEYDRGVDSATRCIEITKTLDPDDAYLAKPLNERAINYACLNQFELAVDDYQAALEIVERTGDEKMRMHLLANIASAFDELKFHEKSIEQNLIALELANRFANERCVAAISVNLGNSYLALRKFSECANISRRQWKSPIV